jgi:hypothetical protein
MSRLQLDVDALYRTLDRRRFQPDGTETSWRDLGRLVGISASTFSRMALGKRPDADALVSLLDWLRMDYRHFVKEAEA